MADPIFTQEQQTWLLEHFASISQIEKWRNKITEHVNNNSKTIESRFSVIEKTVDILESDVREVGGKKVPDPIHKTNKKEFCLTMLEW